MKAYDRVSHRKQHDQLKRRYAARFLRRLVGCWKVLGRVPCELDLKNRAFKLSQAIFEPTQVELIAWYLPRPIPDWPKILGGGRAMTSVSWILDSINEEQRRVAHHEAARRTLGAALFEHQEFGVA